MLVAASGSFTSSLVAFGIASAAGAFLSLSLRKPSPPALGEALDPRVEEDSIQRRSAERAA